MIDYSLVLSDELLSILFEFKNGKANKNHRLIERLLNYYHSPHLTNIDQLKRIKQFESIDPTLLQSLLSAGYISQSLEELSKITRHKLILNTERFDYPYVNINDDKIEKNFSLTFKIGENRDKAVQVIQALCSEAKLVLIFDAYFSKNQKETENFFHQILPKKKLTLAHDNKHLTKNYISVIKGIHPSWTIKPDRYNTFKNSHDRYLIIDNKIEIILSSGFSYLFATDKDLTVVIREK